MDREKKPGSGELYELYERWRRAHDLAREAEARVSEAYDLYLRGEGPAPSEDESRLARLLREVAVERLDEALRFIDGHTPGGGGAA
jgi:hypothetical protein